MDELDCASQRMYYNCYVYVKGDLLTSVEQKGLMTSGNIFQKLILFSIPLLLGNFFQLMYNTIDSVVVGNFVGPTALAAVGASTPIINLMIAFFMGLSTGAGVVVSRYYGARKVDEESRAIHTFIVFSTLFGLGLSILGIFTASPILQLMGTPEDTIAQAEAYLEIYFAGNIFVTIYNAGTGILQAVGDSKTPLYILIATSILNIFLDLFFVVVLKMGVAGAAWATIIAECLSMVLVMLILVRAKKEYQFSFKKLHMDMHILGEIVRIGVPAGLQGMVVSVSNVIVMSYINGFGSASVAGFSSANKYDNFLGLPVNSFMLAITTFVGQNLGAKQYDRVRKGVHAALILSIATVVILGSIVFVFADTCISFFSNDPAVIEAGAKCMRAMCPFYIALCFHQVFSGALRASGRSSVPMITSILAFVVIRQIFLMIALNVFHNIIMVGFSYSITWVLAALFTAGYYLHSHWLEKEEAR